MSLMTTLLPMALVIGTMNIVRGFARAAIIERYLLDKHHK